ncbi:TPA: hypothetical protein N0F65_004635 [Lagenidium giganteum]|uniref:Myb-like domain-containing protein n=1 Tax=Lagenidium giganteum TaxID=4803 RepID=A0AAV2Z7H0_9STRA|nr:TPA: hypothetical protein N0F65_004635 [Lagenidium giganteum]
MLGITSTNPAAEKARRAIEAIRAEELRREAEAEWTEEQLQALTQAKVHVPTTAKNFWKEVAKYVPGKSADDCRGKSFEQFTSPVGRKTSGKRSADAGDGGGQGVQPTKLFRAGSNLFKKQVRQFVQQYEKKHVDDVFGTRTPSKAMLGKATNFDDLKSPVAAETPSQTPNKAGDADDATPGRELLEKVTTSKRDEVDSYLRNLKRSHLGSTDEQKLGFQTPPIRKKSQSRSGVYMVEECGSRRLEETTEEAQRSTAHEDRATTSTTMLQRVLPRVAAMALLLLQATANAEDRCTAILVGAQASTNNAPMTTHTNDCSSCDFRISKVPAQTHPEGSVREIVLAEGDYPRYVGRSRGSVYYPENLDKRFYNWTETKAIGTIPQVAKTYAYIDGTYGIINEHQLAIGESTCGARFYTKPVTKGGEALFDVAELSRVAMERTTNARDAIKLMGDLAVKYGYYGAEWEGDGVYGEAGEALTVTDPLEAWMFHILPDDTGKSAIWAAQRVPDDHFCAVANQFVIHELDLNNTDYFMASPNIYDAAIRNKIWKPEDGPFDFTRVYSSPRAETHQYYSTRRVWRLFTLVNPELKLSPYTDVYSSDYPFSVKALKKLSPQDIMRFQRDHYEGTPFDMTKGPDSGPYGNPDRYDPGVNGDLTQKDIDRGHFERAISIFRASYSFVSVLDPSNEDNALIWFGQYAPHATTYTPVYAKVSEIPAEITTGSLFAFDRRSSFWINALVGNWVSRFYKYAHPFVEKVQLELEDSAMSMQEDILEQAAFVKNSTGEDEMVAFLTNQSALAAANSHQAFSDLFDFLVTSFHDGYHMTDFYSSHLKAIPLFYPKWWLEQVGFFANKDAASSSSSAAAAPSTPAAKEVSTKSTGTDASSTTTAASTSSGSFPIVSTIIVAVVCVGVGVIIGRKSAVKRDGYSPAPLNYGTA